MLRLLDSLLFTIERLWQHRALVLWALVGLSAATTLALSLSLYVDAVNTGLLESRLSDPPYAFRFRYQGSWEGNITQADVASSAGAIFDSFPATIGLPTARQVLYVRAGTWTLRTDSGVNLGPFGVGLLEGADDQITIVAGERDFGDAATSSSLETDPNTASDSVEVVLPVMASERLLYESGVQVGDRLTAARAGARPVTLEVVALWRPANVNDPQWIFSGAPQFFDNVLLAPPDALWQTLEGVERPVEEAAWYVVFDGQTVRTSDVDNLLASMVDGERNVGAALPGIRLDITPVEELTAFSEEVYRLWQQLVLMILPIAGLVLYFVSLVAGLLVSRQQQEDVTLRSRGMSRGALVWIHFLMWLLLAAMALVIAVALSPSVVELVGRTTSFLRFEDTNTLAPVLTPESIGLGALTSLVAASSGLFLAWRTTRQTITSFKRSAGRASKAWWQRMYLDVLVLIPAVYVLYTLWAQGGLVNSAEDPFQDPITFLGPTLFSLGLTLMFLRLLPFTLNILAGVLAYTDSVPLLMALRELTRSIGRYRGILLMMAFTLSLTGYTASMASTIDRSLEDSVNYSIGADAVIVTAADAQTEQGETDEETGQTTQTVTGFNTLPVSDLLAIEEVAQASPVGRYPARLVLRSQRVDGVVLGVDRAAMAAVARSRPDYADSSFADLFNQLAGRRNGILLSEKTARDYNLLIGQEVEVQISALGAWYDMTVPIVGVLDYFPTLNPNEGFFAITNLQPIFETVGTQLPHNIWLSLKPDADPAKVREEVRNLGYPILEWKDPQTALQQARAVPSRRGVLGFLSVGFVASITLTLVGAIIQSTASFRAQVTQLGTLRAMGLSGLAIAMYLIFLQGIAASSGILGGTGIGLATTRLFLPLLDFSNGLPPYLVRVAWDEITNVYLIFAGVLMLVAILSIILLSRESLSTVIKLGDV
jgi:putative ABC transport system permease protein